MTTTTRKQKRIVIVDDEEALLWSLTSRLSKACPDYHFEAGTDAVAALAQIHIHGADLLITDIRMPGMSGIDLALSARQDDPDLPVILMTAYKQAGLERFASRTFTECLEKPFEFARLHELVDLALAPPKLGFSGAISVQTLPDIIQLYALSGATGALSIRNGEDVGEIWFERGAIVHAASGALVGDDAVYETMLWLGGEFAMHAGARTKARTVNSNWQELLMEGCRRMDEQNRQEPAPRAGWTIAPPSRGSGEFDFDLAPTSTPQPSPLPIAAHEPSSTNHIKENDMNIKESLEQLTSLDGYLGAALVDSESGMLLGQNGGGPVNLEVAAAGNTEVVRAKRKTMNSLGIKEPLEDILITLAKQYHIIRPLRSRPSVFYYLVLDRSRANLALARLAVADVEKDVAF